MSFPWILHIRQKNQISLNILIGRVRTSLIILSASCYEDAAVFCCDRAEADRDVEVYVQHLASFSVHVYIVEGHYSLVEFEEVDSTHSHVSVLFLVSGTVFWVAEIAELCLLVVLVPASCLFILCFRSSLEA